MNVFLDIASSLIIRASMGIIMLGLMLVLFTTLANETMTTHSGQNIAVVADVIQHDLEVCKSVTVPDSAHMQIVSVNDTVAYFVRGAELYRNGTFMCSNISVAFYQTKTGAGAKLPTGSFTVYVPEML